jgi:hypothetical protein
MIFSIFADLDYIKDVDRSNYFSTVVDEVLTNKPIIKSLILILLQVVYMILNLNTVTAVPTLYRDVFYGKVSSAAHLSSVMAFIIVYYVYTPYFLIVMLLFCLLILIYIVSLKNPDIRLREYIDMHYSDKIKNKLEKSKIFAKKSNIKSLKSKKVDIY